MPADAPAFLKACEKDGLRVLGWELWIVDHRWDVKTDEPVASPGDWCGGIPTSDGMSLVSGIGNLPSTDDIARQYSNYLRFNFTVVE